MKSTATAILAAILLALSLGGCATPSASPTANTAALQQKVLFAEYGWEGAQALILAYKSRPVCTTPRTVITCKTDAGMTELRKINRAAVAGLDAGMKLASTPGITEDKVTAAIAIATTGVAGVQATIAAYDK